MAVYLLAHVGVVQDAPIAHHGTADALGAPSREAGQEQLLLRHWGEACHHLLHHWNKEGPSIQSRGRAGGGDSGPLFLPGLVVPREEAEQRQKASHTWPGQSGRRGPPHRDSTHRSN